MITRNVCTPTPSRVDLEGWRLQSNSHSYKDEMEGGERQSRSASSLAGAIRGDDGGQDQVGLHNSPWLSNPCGDHVGDIDEDNDDEDSMWDV